jgi:hypothetical protein
MRSDVRRMDKIEEVGADFRSEMRSLRADVASDALSLHAKIDTTRKELGEQIVGLRRAAMEYHSSAIGHGALISELDERLRRVEEHLTLPPRDAR